MVKWPALWGKLCKLHKNERGNVVLIVALAMSALICMTGLVVDMGMVYLEKSNLKKEATTAVISAAEELSNYDPAVVTQAEQRVHDVLFQNLASYNDEGTVTQYTIDLNHQVSVSLEKVVPFTFSKLVGLNQVTVHADAGAAIYPLSGTKGVVPLGIDESVPLTYGQEYTLKVGAGSSTTGFFGILAVDGNGASSYIATLENGSPFMVSVGQILNIKTGNVAGDTQTGIQYRLDSSPYPNMETFHRNDSRIMPIIVYQLLPSNQIRVKGFAYFYLLPFGTDTTVINGIFIKRVGAGTYGSGAVDRGAYAIKLVR